MPIAKLVRRAALLAVAVTSAGAVVLASPGNAHAASTYREIYAVQGDSVECLTIAASAVKSGVSTDVAACTGAADQEWEDVPDGVAPPSAISGETGNELQSEVGNYCLDAETAPIPIGNGTRVQVWTCNGESQQTWFTSGGGLLDARAVYNLVNGRTDPSNGSTLCLTSSTSSNTVTDCTPIVSLPDYQLWSDVPPCVPTRTSDCPGVTSAAAAPRSTA